MSMASRSIKTVLGLFSLRSSNGYQRLISSPVSSCPIMPSDEKSDHDSPASLSSSKPCISVVLHNTNQVFFVNRHILDHWLFQDLLRKGTSKQLQQQAPITTAALTGPTTVSIDCDAILFEFFVWLVENDDPSLRNLNIDDLMEFYSSSKSS